jgi:hypothetical protein
MSHLSAEAFVDLLEGVPDEASSRHLSGCARCQDELASLRGTMSAAAPVDVPEPSPLFWDHLSRRVSEAVAEEAAAGPAATPSLWARWWVRSGVGLAACAALIGLVFTMWPSERAPVTPPTTADATARDASNGAASASALLGSSDDPSLGLVEDLGRSLDWDEMREQMGVVAQPGGLDATVGELDGGERRELERLLKEELARPAEGTDRS